MRRNAKIPVLLLHKMTYLLLLLLFLASAVIAKTLTFTDIQLKNDKQLARERASYSVQLHANLEGAEAFSHQQLGSLQITKEVTNLDETPLTQEQLDQDFAFRVTFSDGDTYPYAIDGGEFVDLSSGGTLLLGQGQSAVFSELPVGVLYTVVEMPVAGYSISSIGHTGNISQEGAVAAFHNRYDGIEALPGDLSVHKEVVGEEIDADQTFSFAVVFSDGGTHSYSIDCGEEQTVTSGGTITLSHDETAMFDDLPEGLTYQITEVKEGNGDYLTGMEEVSGAIMSENVAQVEFYNYLYSDKIEAKDAKGVLTIQNQVASLNEEYGSPEYVIDTQKKFDYTIAFSDDGTYGYTIDGGEVQMLTSGGKLSLSYGQTARFIDVPPEVTYCIQEDDYTGEGYVTPVKKIRGSIVAQQSVGAVFYNYKVPLTKADVPQDTVLTVHKAVSGAVPQGEEAREYAFTIMIDGASTEFTLKKDEEKTFSIPAGSTYQVAEQNLFSEKCMLSGVTGGYGTAILESLECVMTNTYIDTDQKAPNGAIKISLKLHQKTVDAGSQKIWCGITIGSGLLLLCMLLRLFIKTYYHQ